MHDRLGGLLRSRYGDLLPDYPDYEHMEIFSTDVERCMNSASANLARLFYLNNDTLRYSSDLPYAPIPVHAIPQKDDEVNFNHKFL